MVHTAAEVTELVLGGHRAELEQQRAGIKQAATEVHPQTGAIHVQDFSSVIDPDIGVYLTWLLRDASAWGHFADPVWLFTVVIRCRARRKVDGKEQSVRGFDFETEGWARAAMGSSWADYAYRLDSFGGAARPLFFHVLLDGRGEPRLAPSNFNWIQSGPGGRVERHKLRPARENVYVTEYLRRYGDVLSDEPPIS